MPETLEGKVVRFSDKIAYIHHDMDDAIRAGILKEEDVPKEIADVIGKTCGERLDHFIHDIVISSIGRDDVMMSNPTAEAMKDIRRFMFENVYQNAVAKAEEGKAEMLMETLYDYYLKNFDKIPQDLRNLEERGDHKEQIVCDYVGAMTDRYAIALYNEIYVPKVWVG